MEMRWLGSGTRKIGRSRPYELPRRRPSSGLHNAVDGSRLEIGVHLNSRIRLEYRRILGDVRNRGRWLD